MRAEPEERRSVARHAPRRCRSAGYTELINYSFVDAQSENDFAGNADPDRACSIRSRRQMSVMRSTLLGGLVESLMHNLNRKANRVRVFEIGRVYRRDPRVADGPLQVGGMRQPSRVAGLAYGANDDEQWAASRARRRLF